MARQETEQPRHRIARTSHSGYLPYLVSDFNMCCCRNVLLQAYSIFWFESVGASAGRRFCGIADNIHVDRCSQILQPGRRLSHKFCGIKYSDFFLALINSTHTISMTNREISSGEKSQF